MANFGIPNVDPVDIKSQTQRIEITGARIKENTRYLKNILDNYRSWTYRFTLAVLTKEDAKTASRYRSDSGLKFIILQSGGKPNSEINFSPYAISKVKINPSTADIAKAAKDKVTSEFVDEFNNSIHSKVDMFIDDVAIDNLFQFSPNTNVSKATNIKFKIIEPYSIDGLIRSLHANAVAAGYVSYMSATYLLKIEFLGYKDDVEIEQSKPEIISDATRFVPFRFTGMEVELTEKGTTYNCSGVPHNEFAFGQSGKLKKAISVKGKTVKEILENFVASLNSQMLEHEKNLSENTSSQIERYEVRFPEWNFAGGLDETKNENEISKCKVVEVLSQNSVYEMVDPATVEDSKVLNIDGKKSKTVPLTPQVQFVAGSNIHECIAAIVRDSEYVLRILRNVDKAKETGNVGTGMFEYFLISSEVQEEEVYNELVRKPVKKIIYKISPYEIHYSKIPGFGGVRYKTETLSRIALREFNYLYTGKNTDVLDFKLQFNHLYFESLPIQLANNTFQERKNVFEVQASKFSLTKDSKEKLPFDPFAPTTSFTHMPVQPNLGSAVPAPTHAEGIISRKFHDAIVNSKVALINGEIRILGDPMFISTAGLGGYSPIPSMSNPRISINGEAINTYGDLVIIINFFNPEDYNSVDKGGLLVSEKRNNSYFSGAYRILQVHNNFSGGQFTQRLEIQRLPGQFVDDKKSANYTGGLESSDDQGKK